MQWPKSVAIDPKWLQWVELQHKNLVDGGAKCGRGIKFGPPCFLCIAIVLPFTTQ